MSELKIPVEFRKPLMELLSSSEYNSIIDVLTTAKIGTDSKFLSKLLQEKFKLETDKAEVYVNLIFNILYFRYKYLTDDNDDEIIEDIINLLKKMKENSIEDKMALFSEKLKKMFSLSDSVGITVRAIDLMTSQEKYLKNTEVFTDIRPLFQKYPCAGDCYSVLIHQLKIAYMCGGKVEEIYIALDSDDVEKLIKKLQKANDIENELNKIVKNDFKIISFKSE